MWTITMSAKVFTKVRVLAGSGGFSLENCAEKNPNLRLCFAVSSDVDPLMFFLVFLSFTPVGVLAGLSMFLQQGINALLFYIGGWIMFRFPDSFDLNDFLIANFAILFGLFGLGAAFQDIADRKETEKSASRIFYLLDRKSEIDPLSEEGKVLNASVERPKVLTPSVDKPKKLDSTLKNVSEDIAEPTKIMVGSTTRTTANETEQEAAVEETVKETAGSAETTEQEVAATLAPEETIVFAAETEATDENMVDGDGDADTEEVAEETEPEDATATDASSASGEPVVTDGV